MPGKPLKASNLPKPAAPAKAGDLVLMPYTESAIHEINPHRYVPSRKAFALCMVASVDREGRVKSASRPTGWPSMFPYHPEAMILPAARLSESADVVMNLHTEPFETVAAAKAALLRYVLAPT